MAVGSFLFLQEQIKGIIITRSRRVLAGVSVHTRAYYCSSSSCKILAGGTVRAIGEHTYCSTYYKAVREVLVLSVFKRCVYLCTFCEGKPKNERPPKVLVVVKDFFFPTVYNAPNVSPAERILRV